MEIKQQVQQANEKGLQLLLNAQPRWIGIKPVTEAIAGFEPNYILHAGPPVEWVDMHPLQKQGVIGGVLHERLAKTREEAEAMVASGKIKLFSAHDFDVIGAGVGIVTASMVVNVCRDDNTGNLGYCIPFEGRDGLGVWGMYNPQVEENLQLIRTQFAPAVDQVLEKNGGIDIKSIISKSMQMNDEIHTRQTAAGLYLVSEIAPMLLESGLDHAIIKQCLSMFLSTERWFHPLGMAGTMCTLKGLEGLEYCTIVTMICSNGIHNGVKLAATGGQWHLGPAPKFEGQYFSSQWGPDDAANHIGDSTITELVGMGGFAAAAAPAVIRLRGGSYRDAIAQSEELKHICLGVQSAYPIPLLDFTGPPLGVDMRLILDTGITPVCHGGIISNSGGQIGAGAARFPMEPYKEALKAFGAKYNLA